jgi:hypothetical protein
MQRLLTGAAARASVRHFAAASATSERGGAIITGATGNQLHLPCAEDAVSDTYRKALYCPASQTLFTSTHVGTDDDNIIVRGKVGVGSAVEPEEAKIYARNAGLRLLATIHNYLDGDMTRVEQVLKLNGFVNGESGFETHGAVINGCSEVLIEAFGQERGVGVRVCTGAGSLVGAVSCDVELRVRPAGLKATKKKKVKKDPNARK